MRLVAVCAVLTGVLLAGCEPMTPEEKIQQSIRASIALESELDKRCVDGVTYYHRNSANSSLFAPAYGKDGKVILCGGIEK